MPSKKPKFKQHASNYNYKGKRSFGSRLKNFLSIPEEDLKEEESPKFERIKLFRLNQGVIFLSILIFMLIINTLIIFDVNFLYLRQILGFLFIILIPGLLIMLCFKIRTVGFWEYLVYTVGLSVAFIMFAGLAVNWTLPALNITDKPLSLWPILICFNIFLLILWFIAIQRNKDLKPFDVTTPKLDTLNKIFFIIPMAFPLLSILGAFLLNNHGPNILTMIMLGGIAVYVLLLTIFRKKLDSNIWPWALYWMGLALLLMYSMRSQYFMGSDIVSEYSFFKLAAENGFWNLHNYQHTYNICLSINLLPTIINIFIDIPPIIIFKLIMNLIFSSILIIVYLLFKKFSINLFSFLAGFFFISQVGYMMDIPSHIRQGIAFIFFGLMFLILFSNKIKPKFKKVMFILFGISMTVSHYSTTYASLFLFILTYIFILIYKIHENYKIKKGRIYSSQKLEFYLTGFLVLLLILFGFLWYNQITPAASGLIDFVDKSISNFDNLLNQDSQLQGQSFLDQFKLKHSQKDYNFLINEEMEKINTSNISNLYPENKTLESNIRFIPPKIISSKFTYKLVSLFYLFLNFIKRLAYVFIFLGLIYWFSVSKKKRDSENILISIMGIIFFFLIILITIVPFGSLSYGVLRLYQQGLLFFSIFGIIGLNLVLNKVNKKLRFLIFWLFLIIYFLAFAGFFNQVIGGNYPFPNLNNFGVSYDTEYLSNTEIISIKWLSEKEITSKLYANMVYAAPLKVFGNYSGYIDKKVFPKTLTKYSYVYLDNSNKINGFGYISNNFGTITYSYPKKFISDNKNKIYNNGGSEIFR